MNAPLDPRRKRLLYRAQHRSFKEADLVIGGFAEAHVPSMTEAELEEFETLLQFPDPDLYAWIKGDIPPPAAACGPVFDKLCAFELALARR